ncbi:MAG: class I SAM-dependent methyltransferase [Bacteroidota bacterium]
MKDNFSAQAKLYVQFRPAYPAELIAFILSVVEQKNIAWDCGTGNGQIAAALAEYFRTVYATDISERQIENALQKKNIMYRVEAAESTSFPDEFFDVITVAQAIHWFDIEKFYCNAQRTLKTNGILAVIGYSLPRADEKINAIIDDFYSRTLNSYWDAERKYIDELYQTIPFPFREISSPQFSITYEWRLENMLGYLQTWSAVQNYAKRNNVNPVHAIVNDVQQCWKENELKRITFPTLLRIGRK